MTPAIDRYRTLFRDAPAHGIALLDAHGIVVDWNATAARLTGVEPDAAVGRDHRWLLDALGVPDAEGADALQEARAGATVVRDGWVAGAHGRRLRCESRLARMAAAHGHHGADAEEGYAVVIAEAEADAGQRAPGPEASEGRFALALAHAPVHVFNQGCDLRYLWVPVAMPELGVEDPDAAVGATDAELLGEAAAAELTALKRAVLDGDAGRREEVTVAVGDARYVLDLTLEPLHGPDAEVVGLAGVAIDVTERRRMEDELRHSRALLAEAEHLARLGSWEWDVAQDEIRWSDGLYEIYGLTPDTFEASWAAREQREQRVHPDDHARVEAVVAGALERGGEIDIEYRIVRPDGRVRRVHGRAEVVVGEDGRPIKMTGTAQDVTEIRAAEEALERTAAELGRRAAELHQVTRRSPGSVSDVATLVTGRQLEILGLIAEGHANAEIADRLFLSETTVKWHVRQILRKLGVANRAEAVARYVRSSPTGG